MDPNATLALLLDAFRDGDREAAYRPLEDLLDWIAKGGFLPSDPRKDAAPSKAAVAIEVAEDRMTRDPGYVEQAAGERAPFRVYYRRGGKLYWDSIWASGTDEAATKFLAFAKELRWEVVVIRVVSTDPKHPQSGGR